MLLDPKRTDAVVPPVARQTPDAVGIGGSPGVGFCAAAGVYMLVNNDPVDAGTDFHAGNPVVPILVRTHDLPFG